MTNLEKALRKLIRTDGCSNSWDVQEAVDDTISAIDEHIKAELSRLLQENLELRAREQGIECASMDPHGYQRL
jgi:hypothetical protein